MGEVLGWTSSIGDLESDRADVGDESDAVRMSLREVDYSPGYVINGGHLTITTIEKMLERVVQLLDREAKSLAANEYYLRAVGTSG